MRRLGSNDRILADRNLGVVVRHPRSGAGQGLADALEEKGWKLLRQPEPAGAEGRWQFVVRPVEEHSYSSAIATLMFEYGAATGRGLLEADIELYDLGADLSFLEVVTLPLRQAASSAADIAERGVGRVNESIYGAGRGLREAGEGIAGFIRFAQIGGIVLGLAIVVGGIVYLTRGARG